MLTLWIRPLNNVARPRHHFFWRASLLTTYNNHNEGTGGRIRAHYYCYYHELSWRKKNKSLDFKSPVTVKDEPVDLPLRMQEHGPHVHVEMIAAPLNPADVMDIQGRYPSPYYTSETAQVMHREMRWSTQLPGRTVAGSEGWGRVTAVSKHNNDDNDTTANTIGIAVGDYVVPGAPSLGTYRSHVWWPIRKVIPVRRGQELFDKVGGAAASTLFQLGGTALRMLRDFVKLEPGRGDVVVQNGGNSAVGLVASQLASTLFEAKVVSVVRRGQRSQRQFDELKQHVMTVGKNSAVVDFEGAEAYVKVQEKIKEITDGKTSAAKLALNCIGGSNASVLLKLLERGGTMVTYGGMSKQSIEIPTRQLVFWDVRLTGYWHSRWMASKQTTDSDYAERYDMIQELVDLVLDDKLTLPAVEVFRLADCKTAIDWEADQSSKTVRTKVVFDCQKQ